jgi:hypothetical protein
VTVDFKRGLALRNGLNPGLSVREMRVLEVSDLAVHRIAEGGAEDADRVLARRG